jgi:hypothetical protein
VSTEPKYASSTGAMDDKEPSNHRVFKGLHLNMKVKAIGERIVVLFDLSREEYARFQFSLAEPQVNTTALSG